MAPLPARREAKPLVHLPRPAELAGAPARMLRTMDLAASIQHTMRRYDNVLDAIEEKQTQMAAHVDDLEAYDRDLDAVINKMLEPPKNSEG
jgi:hypothetical protein